ncbi:MAG: type VI secretion system accessory protein TagJ [Janthinobacterium lividum]
MSIRDIIRDGDLDGARTALIDAVRADPASARDRLALAEVLIVLGDLVRADTHLDAAQNLDTSFALVVALGRQLIRAATWRNETFTAGRPPELVTARTPAVDVALAVLLAARSGANVAVDEPAPEESVVSGSIDDRPFSGWRDGDDRTAGVLEVLTSTGNYVWIPFEHVRSLRWLPVERLRDTVWRPAELEVADGPNGVVYLPVIYHAGSDQTPDQRLGRATDWVEGEFVSGVGLRTWLIGDEAVSPGDFAQMTVTA